MSRGVRTKPRFAAAGIQQEGKRQEEITEARTRFPIAAVSTERQKIFEWRLCRTQNPSKQISCLLSLRLLLDACGSHSCSARRPLNCHLRLCCDLSISRFIPRVRKTSLITSHPRRDWIFATIGINVLYALLLEPSGKMIVPIEKRHSERRTALPFFMVAVKPQPFCSFILMICNSTSQSGRTVIRLMHWTHSKNRDERSPLWHRRSINGIIPLTVLSVGIHTSQCPGPKCPRCSPTSY